MQIRIWGTSLSLSCSDLTRLIEGYLSKLPSAPTAPSRILAYGLEYLAAKMHEFESHIASQLRVMKMPDRATLAL